MIALLPLALGLAFQVQVRVSVDTRRDSAAATADTVRGDTTERRRERRPPRRMAVTPEHLATAFRDARARDLLLHARAARLRQDSSLRSYDASTYQRLSAGMTLRQNGRERLLFRTENAARVVWHRDKGVWLDLKGARSVFPAVGRSSEVETEINDELPAMSMAPIPYFPGKEELWIPTDLDNPLVRAEVDDRMIVHPLADGAEAYYFYQTGDSITFRLPDGGRILLRELRIESREPRWNTVVGSFWFDVASAHLVRAAYRLAVPMDIWAVATEEEGEDPREDIPFWVLPMISPMEATITAVTIENGLHDGRFWLPRVQSAEGMARAGIMRIPFRIQESFRYAAVNGDAADTLPEVDVARAMDRRRRRAIEDSLVAGLDSSAADSVRRQLRRRWRAEPCETADTRLHIQHRYDGAVPVAVRVPCDTTLLSRSPELPPSIYDPADSLFGERDLTELVDALGIGLQPAWNPQPPRIMWGPERGLLRYNRVEGLSAGVGAQQVLGQGYTAEALVRLGVADLQPNAELTLARSNGRHTIQGGLFRRLDAAGDWGNPFGFGASISSLLFARDEGFYYRAWGAELVGTGERGSFLTWRLFAERHDDADVETQFSLAHAMNGVRFLDNIEAWEGTSVGAQARWRATRGLDPHGFRVQSDLRLEVASADAGYSRGALDLTLSRGLGRRFDGAVTLGAGGSSGTLPPQRLWYLGGSQTVRGQRAGTGVGDAYWLARGELGGSTVAARPVLFYDIGWAGDRDAFSHPGRPMSGAGIGASFLDGLARIDLSRGIAPRQEWRFDLYLESRF